MICHTFSVVSISTTSTNMAAAVIMQTAAAVVFSSCHLPLVRSNSCSCICFHLLLTSLLCCVIVASHRGVASCDLVCSDWCRLVIQVLGGYGGLAGGLAGRVLVLLLRGLVAGDSRVWTHSLADM